MSAVAAALNASMAKERKKSEKRKRKEKEKEAAAAQAKETEPAPLAAADLDFGAFDYDALKADPDAELWLVRVPSGIKPKHLEHLRIDAPSASRTGRVGSLTRKERTYDVWARDPADVDADAAVGGDELGGLAVLLPRAKKGGTLHLAPKAVARHLVLALPPARPEAEAPLQTYQNPPRHAYPEEVLTHRFRPFGARENVDEGGAEAMDVETHTTSPVKVKDKAKEKDSKEKGRKRKVEESPTKVKKAKKAKTDA